MLSGDDLRVADVVREHAAGRGDRRHEARASARSPTRSSTSARTGSPRRCSRGRRARFAGRLPRSHRPEIVELLFAASKIGAVTVPLNWRLSLPELARCSRTPRPASCRRTGVRRARRGARRCAGPPARVAIGARSTRSGSRPRRRSTRVGEESPTTSCSSCTPPGRPASRRVSSRRTAICRRGRDVAVLAVRRETVILTPLPMFHIGGIGWTFLGLWNGATTILVSEFVPERCSTCSSASA